MKKLKDPFSNYERLTDYISDIHKTVNQLIDLVNSQQEAIEKLEKLTGVGKDINPVLIVENKSTDDKAPITTVGIVENGRAIGWGFKWEENTIYPNYNSDGKELIGGYTIEELKKIADDKPETIQDKARKAVEHADKAIAIMQESDTHRTVTLRIPKGECLGGMILDLAESKGSLWVYNLPDTDLQKALDEVKGESNDN